VMVMFLFVIAYIGDQYETPWAGGPGWQTIGAVAAGGAIFVEVVVAIGLKAGNSLKNSAEISGSFGSPAEVGRLFLTDHMLAFEITSIVLLISAVGGVILGTHSRRAEEELQEGRR
jgi:NADH-quinone oxidoreductase subunit J